MKKIYASPLTMLLFCSVLLLTAGCMKDKMTHTYRISSPVYEVLSSFRKSVKSIPAKPFASAGKMTVYGKYIFLNEPGLGIHVIDNSNPSHPQNISFINIPGNVDMAISGSTLYADAYGDLVSFDISDPSNVIAKNFSTNVFPYNSLYYGGNSTNPDSINVIVGWISKDTTVNVNPGGGTVYPLYYGCTYCMFMYNAALPAAASSGTTAATTGTNGSTARFALVDHFLYTVDYSSVSSFDISNRFQPSLTSKTQVDWHVETIYPFKNNLFVGTNNGVYMYDISSSPANPKAAGQFTHVRGCDPVIADDAYAYVTINDSSACLGFNNELQVLSIKDMSNITEVQSYQLSHPVGLSKDGTTLFLCDGGGGLKIYNAADVLNLQLIKQFNDASVYDVIAQNGLAIVLATDGLYQYDYSDLNNIHLLSKF